MTTKRGFEMSSRTLKSIDKFPSLPKEYVRIPKEP